MMRFNLLPPRPRRSGWQRSAETLRGIRDSVMFFTEDVVENAVDFVDRLVEMNVIDSVRQRISALDTQINPRNVLRGTLGVIAMFSVGLHIYEIRQALKQIDVISQLPPPAPVKAAPSEVTRDERIDDTRREFRCYVKRTAQTKITPNCKNLPSGALVSFTINPAVDCPNRDRNGYPNACTVPKGQLAMRYTDSTNIIHTLVSAREGWFKFPDSVGKIWKMGTFEFVEQKAKRRK